MENNDSQKYVWRTWLFVLLALGWSLLFWIPLRLLKLIFNTMPGTILYSVGGLGPAISATYLVRTTQPKEERHEFWRRVTDFNRVPWYWFAVSLFMPLFIALFTVLISQFISIEYTRWQPMWSLLQNPLMLILFWFQHYFSARFQKKSAGAVMDWNICCRQALDVRPQMSVRHGGCSLA